MTRLPQDPTDATPASGDVRRVVLAPRGGAVSVERGAPPVLGRGEVLIRTAYSVVSAGTERSKLELAGKGLIGKARSRPELLKQVLDKVRAEGATATLQAVRRRLGDPLALGYSNAGEVLAVGTGVEGIGVGDRVAAGGGRALHADVVAVPRNLVAKVPDGVPLDAAAFATIGSVAMHAVRLSGAALGETVVVVGLGLVGLLAGGVARAAGCRVIGVDVRADAAARAVALGFDDAASGDDAAARAVERATGGLGADCVLLCASASDDAPMRLAARIARDRARVVVVGELPVHAPRDAFYDKELELVVSRSYGPGRYDPSYEEGGQDYPPGFVRWTEGRNLQAFLDLLARGRLEVEQLVTHRVPVERAADAYEVLVSTPGSVVLLDFGGAPEPRAPRISAAAPGPVPRGELRVGLIGTGSFAERVLIPAIRAAGAEVQAVAAAQGRPTPRAGDARLEASPEALIAAGMDAVFIATRHDSHAGLTRAALQAGVAVFVEKPLALTRNELDTVTEAWEAAGVAAMVGFNRRHATFTRTVAEGLARRSGPAVVAIRVNAGPLEAGHWLLDTDTGGGRILGEACHFIDLAAHLVGADPVEVGAVSAGAPSPLGAQDVVVTMRFADGSVASVVYVSVGDPALGKERVEAFADSGAWVIDDWRTLQAHTSGRRVVSKGGGDKGHRAEVAAFLAAVRAGDPIEDQFRAAIVSTRATLASVEALALGLPVAP